MPFHPSLPTFNQLVTIHRVNALGVWVPDGAPTACQVYFPKRNFQLTWESDYITGRGVPGATDYQISRYNIFVMFPLAAVLRDPYEILLPAASFPNHDFFRWPSVNFGIRDYWIDQVEPRWAGFPNEHRIAVCTRK